MVNESFEALLELIFEWWEVPTFAQCNYIRDWLAQWFENGMRIFRMSGIGGFRFFQQDRFTGMSQEVPAFAGMTTLLGEIGEIPAFAGI